jgi:hypothetical protein
MTSHRVSLLSFAVWSIAMPGVVRAAEPNPVATAMAFAHLYGTPDALTPANDRALKTKLIVAVSKSPELTLEAAGDLFDKETFRTLAGGKNAISVEAMDKLVREKTPQSRKDLNAKTCLHADLLATQFDLIEEQHRKPAAELVDWIVKNYKAGQPLGVVVICSHNTRRSVLGATMGKVAAAYYGLPDVTIHSGGTDPVAINPRSIATLKEIGIEFERSGKEAARGSKGEENPVYRVKWGKGLEADEFSKKYADPANPQERFAAVMVCGEADDACPTVAGAGVRVAVPYLDPKAFDGAAFEAGKYAERRDDEGRFMLSVMMQARRRLEAEGKLK